MTNRVRLLKKTWLWGLLFVFLLMWLFCLPSNLFNDPTCVVLEDSRGELLGAKIAEDGQWRFPFQKKIPEKFQKAIITFEDKRFFAHPGVDIFALARAFRLNAKAGKIVSGGSTVSMQVIRLSRKGKSRTVYEKLVEILKATRLEFKYSKEHILALYTSNAPFGGNVVGLEAASWRYYGKSQDLLSWSEAATLAVLPNSPGLIHPGRNREKLQLKRDFLLKKLWLNGTIDSLSFALAKEEKLPQSPQMLPRDAPHLLNFLSRDITRNGSVISKKIQTTIDGKLQIQIRDLLLQKMAQVKENQIHNAAVLVTKVKSGEVLAYLGNAPNTGTQHDEAVDIIQAPRSTGSVLKPILYALAIDEGIIQPPTLLPDIPINFGGFTPLNFDEKFNGATPAKKALIRSLNVPMVKLLQNYGLEKFHGALKQLKLRAINKKPDHYGLSLILGGAESSLWELNQAYTGLTQCLNNFSIFDGRYAIEQVPNLVVHKSSKNGSSPKNDRMENAEVINAGAIYLTFESMRQLERPNSSGDWESFSNSRQIAWKTGTSFGFRDAWAIGITPEYVVSVWVGNADGEGRPGLTGIKAAAPILFDVFEKLPATSWFEMPFDDLRKAPVCQNSGFVPNEYCASDTIWTSASESNLGLCKYHQLLHLDPFEEKQVNSNCCATHEMRHVPWFILPPVIAHYYQKSNPEYRSAPIFKEGCRPSAADQSRMQLIYPREMTNIIVPIDLDGNASNTIFKAAHIDENAIIHWHLDDNYLGATSQFHHYSLNPKPGKHIITLVDHQGSRIQQKFEILAK